MILSLDASWIQERNGWMNRGVLSLVSSSEFYQPQLHTNSLKMRLVLTALSPAVVSSLLVWRLRRTGRASPSASTPTARTGTWPAWPVSTWGAANTTTYTGGAMRFVVCFTFSLFNQNMKYFIRTFGRSLLTEFLFNTGDVTGWLNPQQWRDG